MTKLNVSQILADVGLVDRINILLHHLPLNLYIKYVVSCNALRHCESRYWTAKIYGVRASPIDKPTHRHSFM